MAEGGSGRGSVALRAMSVEDKAEARRRSARSRRRKWRRLRRKLRKNRLAAGVVLLAVLTVVAVGFGYVEFQGRTAAPGADGGPATGQGPADGRLAVAAADDDLRVIFAGAGLTHDVSASEPVAGYRARATAALGDEGQRSVGFTVSGGARMSLGGASRQVYVADEADLVVLEFGSSDIPGLSVEDFRSRYTALVERVHDQAPRAAVVCLGVWATADVAQLYDPAVRGACNRVRSATFVPLHDLFDQTANRGPAGRGTVGGVGDAYQPNDRGHAEIASRLTDAISID